MKNFKKRLIALVALTCVALSAFAGCSNKEASNKKDESSIEPVTAVPFHWGGAEDNELTMDGVEINEDDPVKADHVDLLKSSEKSSSADDKKDNKKDDEEGTTGYVAGEPVTEIVAVTEANGEPVTQADGQPVTEVKTITNSTPQPDNSSSNNNNAGSNTDANYVSNTKGMYAMWIDISKNEDFVFNDSIIRITFRVKDNAPDGIYDIAIDPDLSSIEGVTITPDTILNGSIKVGNVSADSVDPASMNGFAVYGDKVSAKQGDTIEFCINMKDNPGLAAMCIWYYYDSNALEIVDCTPDGEFAVVSSNSTQMGE
ncbi:MAG: hypothetical protein K2F73_00425 [Ruminococcus sp.]|nr:hypothetical protein [Ruminococcus sp.]